MAKELADAIVDASVIMQKKEEEEALVVAAYLSGCENTLLLTSADGRLIERFENYIEAIHYANDEGYRRMQGDAVNKLLERTNSIHKERCLDPVYELFEKKA